MRSSRLVAVAVATAIALLASACAGSDSAGTTPKGAALGTDEMVDALARSGIATLDDAGGEPLTDVTAPASPVQLRELQVRAMASEAQAGNGFGGDDLDRLGGGNLTPVPASALLAAYVRKAQTPGAELARDLMDARATRHPSAAIFPSVVMVLFASDAARALAGDAPSGPATTKEGAVGTARVLDLEPIAFTPCRDVSSFIFKTIDKVFAAIHIPPGRVGKTGSKFLDWLLQGLTDVVVAGLNFVINAAKEFLVNGVKYVLAQVLDIVAKVATLAALVANIGMAVSPWNLILAAADPATTKGVAPDVVKDPVTVSARLDGPDEWPAWFADCAKAAGVTLPPLKPVGAKVTWKVFAVPFEAELVTERSKEPDAYDAALHEPPGGAAGPAEATLRLVTGSETPKQAKGKPRVGLVRVDVQIRRPQIEDLRTTLVDMANNLANSVLQSIPAVFRTTLLEIVGVGAKTATEDLASLIDGKANTQIAVTYHGEPEKQKPSTTTTATTGPPASGAFCAILKRAFLAQTKLLEDLNEENGDATLDEIQAINRQIEAAAPAELRSTVSTFVAGVEALVAAMHAGQPDAGAAMRTPAVQAASRRLYDYATKVCKIPPWTTSGG